MMFSRKAMPQNDVTVAINPEEPVTTPTESNCRFLCRHRVETLEHWSRRLITDAFTEPYGKKYWEAKMPDGNQLVKTEIRNRVEARMQDNPCRYPRWIDAVLLDDVRYFFCRDDLYRNHFKAVFEPFYSGVNELRSVLKRLADIRNKLAHGNAISTHEVEQVLCYTDDIIECMKAYYSKLGKSRKYNVPFFTSAQDSFGNVFIRNDPEHIWEISHLPLVGNHVEQIELRSGDCYKLWVEVDGAFPQDSYTVEWTIICGNRTERGNGNTAEIAFDDKDVSFRPEIRFTLRTNNTWHKHAIEFDRSRDYDDSISWSAASEVLPPIESTY